MNATSSGRDAYDSEDSMLPATESSRNSGMAVPSGNIVEGVAVMVERPVYAGQRSTEPALTAELSECEGEFDRDEHGHGFSEARAWSEPPLLGGLDGFLIEPERRVE